MTKKRYEINVLNVTSCKSLAEYLSLVPAAAVGGTNTLTKTEECVSGGEDEDSVIAINSPSRVV